MDPYGEGSGGAGVGDVVDGGDGRGRTLVLQSVRPQAGRLPSNLYPFDSVPRFTSGVPGVSFTPRSVPVSGRRREGKRWRRLRPKSSDLFTSTGKFSSTDLGTFRPTVQRQTPGQTQTVRVVGRKEDLEGIDRRHRLSSRRDLVGLLVSVSRVRPYDGPQVLWSTRKIDPLISLSS